MAYFPILLVFLEDIRKWTNIFINFSPKLYVVICKNISPLDNICN